MKNSKTFGPYSLVRQAGGLYFTAGHVGVDSETGTAEHDVVAQTKQVIKNLADTLQGVGLTLDDVIKTTLYVTDMGDFAAINQEYTQHFSEPRPARSTVTVWELPRLVKGVPLKIEIEAIAAARTKGG